VGGRSAVRGVEAGRLTCLLMAAYHRDTARQKGVEVVTVLISHRVADYDRWKLVYDEIAAGPLAAQVRSFRIWRGQDDPNLVILAEAYDSRAVADAVFANPDLPAAIASSGVDMSTLKVEYLDEVAARVH
jgi:quinol monooxygenase YgiN